MKLKIQLNDFYAQKLLSDRDFRNNLDFVINNQLQIEQVWIENTVADNSEIIFRAQTLNLIRQHYARIFEVQANLIEIAHQENTVIPTYLYKIGQLNPLKTIVSITDIQID